MLAVYVMGKEFTGCQYIRFSVISSVPFHIILLWRKAEIFCRTKWCYFFPYMILIDLFHIVVCRINNELFFKLGIRWNVHGMCFRVMYLIDERKLRIRMLSIEYFKPNKSLLISTDTNGTVHERSTSIIYWLWTSEKKTPHWWNYFFYKTYWSQNIICHTPISAHCSYPKMA